MSQPPMRERRAFRAIAAAASEEKITAGAAPRPPCSRGQQRQQQQQKQPPRMRKAQRRDPAQQLMRALLARRRTRSPAGSALSCARRVDARELDHVALLEKMARAVRGLAAPKSGESDIAASNSGEVWRVAGRWNFASPMKVRSTSETAMLNRYGSSCCNCARSFSSSRSAISCAVSGGGAGRFLIAAHDAARRSGRAARARRLPPARPSRADTEKHRAAARCP